MPSVGAGRNGKDILKVPYGHMRKAISESEVIREKIIRRI